MASVAFITTWIGAELGYIGDGIKQVEALGDTTPYAIFLESLKYSFYPVLTLVFILFIIFQKRDYGPMLRAEHRARATGKVKNLKLEVGEVDEVEDLTPVARARLNPLAGHRAGTDRHRASPFSA